MGDVSRLTPPGAEPAAEAAVAAHHHVDSRPGVVSDGGGVQPQPVRRRGGRPLGSPPARPARALRRRPGQRGGRHQQRGDPGPTPTRNPPAAPAAFIPGSSKPPISIAYLDEPRCTGESHVKLAVTGGVLVRTLQGEQVVDCGYQLSGAGGSTRWPPFAVHSTRSLGNARDHAHRCTGIAAWPPWSDEAGPWVTYHR